MNYRDVEAAYNDCTIGRYEPELMVVAGSTILAYRPDLEGVVDPDRVYYISREGSIVECPPVS